MDRIPECLKNLVNQFAKFPGLGPKSAMRVAMTLLKWPESEVRSLGQSIFALRDSLHLCVRCGALTDKELCLVCADVERREDLLCLVAEWDSMITLEEGRFFKGRYLILGGLLAPLDNMTIDKLDIERLTSRLAEGQVQEIVFALGATIEAETTIVLIRNLLTKQFPHIKVTRLAQGIPLGAEVKFMDQETLRQSLQYRQEVY